MPKGGPSTTWPNSQPFTPSRNSDRSTATAARFRSRVAGFSLGGPHRQPSAEVGSPGQGPRLEAKAVTSPRFEAKDEAITSIPMPFGHIPRNEAKDEAIACIPMPFGLGRLGCDSRDTDSHDGGKTGLRGNPTTVQQPAAHSRNKAPEPLAPSGEQCPGQDICSKDSKQEAESGLNGRTTVMIRCVPQDLTRGKLAWELATAGFADDFDYVYIPLDRGLLARPMVFVNFTSGEAAEKFYQAFNGRPFRSCGSPEPVFVIAASLQGIEQNFAHHLAVMKRRPAGKRNTETGPLFRI